MRPLIALFALLAACGPPTLEDRFNVGDNPGLYGQACSPSGSVGIPNAQVQAFFEDESTAEVEALSDGDGEYHLSVTREGTYTVVVEKGNYRSSAEAEYTPGLRLPVEDICIDASDVRIAVVTGEYDSIGMLITRLGFEVETYDGESVADPADMPLLYDLGEMLQYDIIFYNCGMAELWYEDGSDVADNLQSFVNSGGSVYASDWASAIAEVIDRDAIAFAHEDVDEFNGARVGATGVIDARVLDPTLNIVFGGRTAEINYELPGWVAVESIREDSQALLRGDHTDEFGQTWTDVPLAVRYRSNREGGGEVIYTSFHNEAQATEDMFDILYEFILSL